MNLNKDIKLNTRFYYEIILWSYKDRTASCKKDAEAPRQDDTSSQMWNFLIYLNLWWSTMSLSLRIWSSQRAFPERLPLTHTTVLWDSEEAGGLNVLVWMCGAFSFGKYSVIYDTQMHTQALIQCWVNIDNPLEVSHPPTHTLTHTLFDSETTERVWGG